MNRPMDDLISIARSVRIEEEAGRRGVRLKGRVDRAGPCPRCGGRDRFSINLKKQVFNCRGCQRGGDVIELVQFLDDVDFRQAVALLAGDEEAPRRRYLPPSPAAAPDNRAFALKIWLQAVDPRGTLVESYLKRRCLKLPDEAALDVIRFHANCPFGEERFPAMVCLVRNILTNEPQAVHRTALAPDGTAIKRDGKTFRLSLGPVAGGAIKIDPDEDVTQSLCIGEGIETCLSGRALGIKPVWALGNAGAIDRLAVLAGVDSLIVHREHCPYNEAAFRAVADRWLAAGREVVSAWPEHGKDANDELLGKGQ